MLGSSCLVGERECLCELMRVRAGVPTWEILAIPKSIVQTYRGKWKSRESEGCCASANRESLALSDSIFQNTKAVPTQPHYFRA